MGCGWCGLQGRAGVQQLPPGTLDGAVCSVSSSFPGWSCVLCPCSVVCVLLWVQLLALAAQQVPGAALGSSLAVPLVLYSVSELLCSLAVVKTVNTGVTQRINGNDMRVVLVDNQCFLPPSSPTGLEDTMSECRCQ